MQLNRTTLRVVLAASLATCFAYPAYSHVSLDIEVAPPAPLVAVVPPPRAGFVWAPGYWRWQGHRHVWVDGYWLRARPGHYWVPDRWTHHGGHYRFERGHWAR